MLSVDRVRRADDRDGTQLLDAAARFLDRHPDVVHRDLRGEFEALRIALAIIGGPVVVRAGQCRRVVGCEIVVTQDLPAARAVHHGNVDALDIHRRQRRGGIEAPRLRNIEMRVARTALAPELAARGGRALRPRERRDRQPLHLHRPDRVSASLVLGAFCQSLLLAAEKLRRVRPIGAVQIARPEVVRLVEVHVAVDDQVAFACHACLRWIE